LLQVDFNGQTTTKNKKQKTTTKQKKQKTHTHKNTNTKNKNKSKQKKKNKATQQISSIRFSPAQFELFFKLTKKKLFIAFSEICFFVFTKNVE
jgi:hypothetical protein